MEDLFCHPELAIYGAAKDRGFPPLSRRCANKFALGDPSDLARNRSQVQEIRRMNAQQQKAAND
jgi:hypothetical protein